MSYRALSRKNNNYQVKLVHIKYSYKEAECHQDAKQL